MTSNEPDLKAEIETIKQDQEALLDAVANLTGHVEAAIAATTHHESRLASLETLWPNVDDGLTEWVNDWLTPTFALHIVLADWDQHAGISSELQALHVAYQHMAKPDAHGFDPVTWHSHLASMISRLADLKNRTNALASETSNDDRLTTLLGVRADERK